ncbi:MAG: glycoside hydrolase family 3 C-terminal domain-containing protein [Bacteroidota bacterium]|jgi:beta-glucosidase
MRFFVFLFLLFTFSVFSQESQKPEDYLNPNLAFTKRVDDLISRMTLDEKASQMLNAAKAIPRLNIPEYNWWNECLHGVARSGTATVFPQAIGLAATWNTDLMLQVADVISTEARAKYNDFIRKNDRTIFKGLTFWSPNINIFRDPRWGRGQETYGEDPYLTSRMGVAFVKGLQGNDSKYFKVIATPKHYAVHSGPEPDRHTFNAIISNHDLYDTYLPAFEACIKEAGAYSVMCAYNRFMGEACCGSPTLLHKILRDNWRFEGYVVSDCGAIDDIFMHHKIVETAPEAAALSVKSGTDLECGNVYESALLEAVKKGLLSEEDINVAVKRLFTARFRLGMFDPPEMVKYNQIPLEEVDSKEHRQLSIRAAQESIVLLKNKKDLLPLNKNLKRIAVIGPTADSYPMLLGNYNGTPSKFVTPLQGVLNKVTDSTNVVYEQGCDLVEENAVVNNIPFNVFSFNTQTGLQTEYFKNNDLKGDAFFTRINPLNNTNWIYGAKLPSFQGLSDLQSVRWSGTIQAPETGEYNLVVKSDGGFRLYIDDKIILDHWTAHELTSKSNRVRLEKEKSHLFKLEYFQCTRRPQLIVQWELLNIDHFKKAVELARNSDVVVFVGGITTQLEGEEMRVDYEGEGFKGGDRTNLDLPKVQEKLLRLLYSTGTPIVLVLTSGSALSTNWEKENIPAIIQLWYPGQEGGTALADVLFGDYNPAGRLPITFYKSVDQLPPFEDYNMTGRTYRYFKGEPLFSFGYGLSYTKFEYSNLIVPDETKTNEGITVSVEVHNVGKIAGDEVVQLYLKNLIAAVPVPIHSLQGFKRIHMKPGEKQLVQFQLLPRQLAVSNETMKFFIEPGSFEITVGGLQPGFTSSTTECLSKRIHVVGNSFDVE